MNKNKQQQPAFKPRQTAQIYVKNRQGQYVLSEGTVLTKNKQQRPAFKPEQHIRACTGMQYVLSQRQQLAAQIHHQNTFQAPHHQQESEESLVELSDDTSPNTPLGTATGGWKPVQSAATIPQSAPTAATTPQSAPTAATTPQSAPTEIKMKRNEERRRVFIERRKMIKEITKMKYTYLKPVKPIETNITTSAGQKKPQSTEIKWELNVLDEKEEDPLDEPEKQDSTHVEPPKPIKPQVIQGTASEIKLFQTKDQPQQSISLNTTPKPETSASANPPTVSRNWRKLSSWRNLLTSENLSKYPTGVPRSFLSRQMNQGSIEPQDQLPKVTWTPNMIEDPGLYIHTEQPVNTPLEELQYSPSDVYEDGGHTEQGTNDSESLDGQGGQKRLSAFRRLGPVSQPKKPKLMINLLCNKDQSVREVLEDEIEEKYTPVHLRKDILESSDETVMKYLPFWPWKRNVLVRKAVTSRTSRSVMILEQEQMEEVYEKDNMFLQVTVRGYPRFWKKEHVLDVILEHLKGKTFIPCLIEFKPEDCKFLVIRSRSALLAIHKLGFFIRKDDVELSITISQIDLNLNHIDFIPRLVLRKQLAAGYDSERKLSLKEFTLKPDVSHFIYFPLNRVTNQTELVQLQSTIAWNFLTDLDLSHNRITSIDGFELPKTTPKLKHLDLSYNWLDKVTSLLYNRELALRSLKLEGNPLCHDYIDPAHYVRVVKMIFPALTEIDGVPINLKGDLPHPKRNYCPSEAAVVAGKFLEVFFPLLEAPVEERSSIEDMYDEKAVLTVTYRCSLRYSPLHRKFRNIFLRARVFDEGDAESVEGAPAIARLVCKWPMLQHDPYTFTVDVLHHSEYSTILRVDGILKLTSKTLAEDEHLLAFTRTLVLSSLDGIEYKILNEMVYWDEPSRELANTAFQMNTIRTTKRLSLKLDSAPDEELKGKLKEIFMSITELDEKTSERCLELKEWNLKSALEYFVKLVKLDDFSSINRDLEMDRDKK